MSDQVMNVSKGKLVGEVTVSGAKNSSLRLLAASLLTDGDVELYNFPNGLLDVQVHLDMLKVLGKEYASHGDYVKITETANPKNILVWNERSIRNTLLILGALTTRFGEGRVPLPGGCKLGERKYDLHVMLLENLGARVWEEDGYLCAKSEGRLKGADIVLPMRSTGATENSIIAASLAKGTTTLWNPHIRPEIMDLIDMMGKMGAKIEVFGQKCIVIEGVEKLTSVRHSVIPDNMEALTWAIGSVITGGEVEIKNFPFEHLEVPMVYLRESGMKFFRGSDSLIVRGGSAYPVEISTGPYPGINSDMQPLFAVYGAMSRGESKIVDLRFPGRYGYAEELAKMGMKYRVEGDMLVIDGGTPLQGARVNALDLRAGISLLLAGLTAEGTTTIENAWQIGRGYENLQQKLDALIVR
ncbi:MULTISPECIES: UDP-N-acetylglucosamine 1-carboxyvinyltransferase [unclassified Flavobacterium]|uniref:UDP-N-acetylglucosamine 1-carboxyvinyltransferase n=1 Tax=unclassified Flavobacterium TaxID=196869 RepID=UPI001F138F82|nr:MULTISPECIES: UDP-N-acetylglucosamine 1-carboxyvinyltransferase [unclassified Flavobacterium]UMY65844.1 UDP-N-acetylglucosamine 1-carboxyvinyltransferase [Flavobacterium sp. HJ-32-4]HLN96085.1 UDP-N-acetylglucosamine 1-carboxyvinyltransferase [Flavobacterium sp.]